MTACTVTGLAEPVGGRRWIQATACQARTDATRLHSSTAISQIAGLRNPVLGRGVIVHAKPDDGGQPTGNAGARIGQGVIGLAKSAQ